MLVKISVQLKPGILDPRGKAVAGALRELGFTVNGVRMGKELVIDIPAADEKTALTHAQTMALKLLANPVTEDYSCQVVGE